MKVLITGSNGFIGGHVCKYLKEKGEYVIGLGRREKSVPEVDEYICCDMDSEAIDGIMASVKVDKIDAIIHLAADMRKEPYNVEVVAHNCVGTQRLLEFAEREHIGVFYNCQVYRSLETRGASDYRETFFETAYSVSCNENCRRITCKLCRLYAWGENS